jgi:uncharacterized protein (DUF1330 family)
VNADVFSAVPPRKPVALIDLVETATPEASRAFVAAATRAAEAASGRLVLANEAITPMIIPDGPAQAAEHAIRLLVVTRFPTRQAGEIALEKRKGSGPELSGLPVRTYAARPAARLESWFGRALPYTLGLLRREPAPKLESQQQREALIQSALILDEQSDASRWTELVERSGGRPIWMLNFLEFAKTAVYADDAQGAAPAEPISGARAYQRYGSGMIGSLAAVGGRVGWSGRTLGQLAGRDDGRWHQVAIAVYPSAAAMMTMLALPKYRAAHVHRAAALARTRLLATEPIRTARQ